MKHAMRKRAQPNPDLEGLATHVASIATFRPFVIGLIGRRGRKAIIRVHFLEVMTDQEIDTFTFWYANDRRAVFRFSAAVISPSCARGRARELVLDMSRAIIGG